MKIALILIMFASLSVYAEKLPKPTKIAKINCEFSKETKVSLLVNLKTKIAKQLANEDMDEFPAYSDLMVTSHTTIYGDVLNSFNQTSVTGSGVKVIWDAQLILMGSNHDDSNFTLVVAYRDDGSAKATLISYWDGLDGKSESENTEKCTIEYR